MSGLLRTGGVLAALILSTLPLCAQSTAIVDYDADEAFSVPVSDSTATALVGNVIFHHNGAILTCDSAILYNSRNYVECFKNVIINRDSTYVYGDRADFNGITNIARVYAPIVKTVDGDMTMYSYDMEFNTLTNIGRYTAGGTIAQKDNLMESRQAIYHADERQVYFVGEVAMRNEEYLLQTDSMGYNFDTETTDFYRPATIWNSDGDFLSADRGSYDRANDTYVFTQNSYILTSDNQEVFADSLTYVKPAGLIAMSRRIQMHDPEQRTYLFGDYGAYWETDQQAVMTENPSAIGYDDAEQPDSTYLRGDSLFMHTLRREEAFTPEVAARLRLPRREELDSVRRGLRELYPTVRPDTPGADSLGTWGHLYGTGADTTLRQYGMQGLPPDSLAVSPDSSGIDPPVPDSPPRIGEAVPLLLPDSAAVPSAQALELPAEQAAQEAQAAVEMAEVAQAAVEMAEVAQEAVEMAEVAQEAAQAALALVEPPSQEAVLPADAAPEPPPADSLARSPRQLRRERRLAARSQRMREYALEQGIIPSDTAKVVEMPDSLAAAGADSLILTEAAAEPPRDSLQRVIRAHGRVKSYRTDLQMVCDSLVAFSIDSTAYLYLDPILWNEENQITADSVHLYSRNEQLHRADFMGSAIMAQWVLDSLYNQISGERIEAFFRDNEIRQVDVLQNSRTYFYPQEDDKPDQIGGFADIRSPNLTFRFDSLRRVERIIWLGASEDIQSAFYPMDRIPAANTQRLPGFEWLPHLRPANPRQVCEREIRPSQQEQSRSIPYPPFRITEEMETDRRRYTEAGIWRDRSETIRIDPAYFINLTN